MPTIFLFSFFPSLLAVHNICKLDVVEERKRTLMHRFCLSTKVCAKTEVACCGTTNDGVQTETRLRKAWSTKQ